MQEALHKSFVISKMTSRFSSFQVRPSEWMRPREQRTLSLGGWVGGPLVLCRSHPCVAYKNDLFRRHPPPAVPLLSGRPSPASALRTGSGPHWTLAALTGEKNSHSIAPGQVHLLLQLSKPGSLGAGGGASTTFSVAASEHFEFH